MIILSLLLSLCACQSLVKLAQFKVNQENPGKLSVASFDIAFYYKNSLYSYNISKKSTSLIFNNCFSAGFSQLKGAAKQRYIILAEQIPDWSQRTLKFQIINRVDLSFLTYAYTAFQHQAIIQSASLLQEGHTYQQAEIKQFKIGAITSSGKICGWTFNVEKSSVVHDYCVIAHAINATCIISADDGASFITGGSDKAIRIWTNGKAVMSFIDNEKAVSCLHVSHDLKYLISGNQGGIIKVYDYALYWLKFSQTVHKGKINSITTSNDSKILVSSGEDNMIVVRNIAQNKLIDQIKVDSVATQVKFAISNFKSAIYSSQSSEVEPTQYLYSSHRDGSVSVWKVNSSGLKRVHQDQHVNNQMKL